MSGNNREEIKHVVDHVKCKKIEGSLYVMSERIAWMPKGKNNFSISHHYVDIKTQKISTEGKAKIQLQVVLHDDSSTTFHFINPSGPEAQLKDRDLIKDSLANLLPKFKQKISDELEEKKKVLVENPHIYQLYNDLVVGQMVSAEDFWKNFVNLNDYKQTVKNQTGVSQGFMANICPKSDGTNGLVYNISYDDKQSILKTYPAVKLKYVQNVPQKMSEVDFWTKFFQSFYFRKDQINMTSNDLFSDCANKDDEELKSKAEKTLSGPIDIIDSQKTLSSDDGFGLTDFTGNKTGNLSHQNLIKRYNYYSMRVLSSMEEISQKEGSNKTSKNSSGSNKKICIDEEIKDLEKDEEMINLKGASLNLKHIDRYFYAPKTNDQQQSKITKILKTQNSKDLCEKTLKDLSEWNLNVKKVTNPSLAIGILVELSPGSQLMHTNNVQNLRDEIPKAYQEEIKSVYLSSCEMLKTYHAMFPPKNTEHELKLKLMRDTIEAYYQQKVISIHDRLSKDNFSWNITSHLENMFKIALLKYNTWKMKQSSN